MDGLSDFFVSYTAADQAWAEWIAWQLEEAGYTIEIQAWDYAPGSNFVARMNDSLVRARRTIAVLSPEYLTKAFPESEWTAALVQSALSRTAKLIPIRVRDFQVAGLLAPITYIDFVGKEESDAKAALLAGLSDERRKPSKAPAFPGPVQHSVDKPARFPGVLRRRIEGNRANWFVCAKIMGADWLSVDDQSSPYAFDPVGDPESKKPSVTALWLPREQYFRAAELSQFTPAVAICTPDPAVVVGTFRARVEGTGVPLDGRHAIKYHPNERETVFTNLGLALRDCFIVSATMPRSILGVARNRPELAYRAMLDIFLVPLLELHSRPRLPNYDLRLSRVGALDGVLLKYCKTLTRAIFSRPTITSVDFVGKSAEKPEVDIAVLAWYLAWAVSACHNSDNPYWLSLIRNAFTTNDMGSSPLEEPTLGVTSHATLL